MAAPFFRYFMNSLMVSLIVSVGVVITSLLAAFAFVFLKFNFKKILFNLFISTMMIPFEAIMIQNFMLIKKFGWYNSYWALIVPWLASAFAIFLFRQSFMQIPKDYIEAAELDGCFPLELLWTVVIPLSKSAIATVFLFSFLGSWNSLLWPILVTDNPDLRVIQFGLALFLEEQGTQYPLLMAASTLTILPVTLLYFFVQRQFIEGMTGSGLK